MPWDAVAAWTTITTIVYVLFVAIGITLAVLLIRFLVEGTRAFRKFNANGSPRPNASGANLKYKPDPRTVSPLPPESPHAPPTPALGIQRPPAWKPPPSQDRSANLDG